MTTGNEEQFKILKARIGQLGRESLSSMREALRAYELAISKYDEGIQMIKNSGISNWSGLRDELCEYIDETFRPVAKEMEDHDWASSALWSSGRWF